MVRKPCMVNTLVELDLRTPEGAAAASPAHKAKIILGCMFEKRSRLAIETFSSNARQGSKRSLMKAKLVFNDELDPESETTYRSSRTERPKTRKMRSSYPD